MRHPRTDYNERIQDSNPRGIPVDEPVFLLRAQDRLAADTVDFWADAAESIGVDPETVEAARQWADHMRQWPRRKLPDTPPELLEDPSSSSSSIFIDLGPPDLPDKDPLEGADTNE